MSTLLSLALAAWALTAQSGDGPDVGAVEGVTWKLEQVAGQVVPAGTGPREAHLRLNGSRATGATGCNTFSGGYTLRDDSLTFGEFIATRMHCRDAMDLETAFLKALGAAKTWRMVGRRLELVDEKGQTVARFAPADEM